MKRLLVAILICFLLVGCSKGNLITGGTTVDTEQIINCGDCDDGNKCTTDICAGDEQKTCLYVPITRCCGNDKCDKGESCLNCEEDCGKCYTLAQLQRDANKVYDRNVAFTQNKVVAKRYGEVISPDYDFYDSTFLTAIFITNDDLYLSDYEDFKDFVVRLTKARFNNFQTKLADNYPSKDYRFVANDSLKHTASLMGDMIIYNYWAKIYRKYRSLPNIRNESYETESLDDPALDATVYIKCSHNLVLGLYSNQPQMLDRFWTNLDEGAYETQIQKWLDLEARGAADEATKFLDYCTRG
jgi:hypothetical protein